MNPQQAKKKLGKIDWYQQASPARLFFLSYPWYACLKFTTFSQQAPVKYRILFYVKGSSLADYISKRSLKRTANYYSQRQKRNPRFIYQLSANWHQQYVRPCLKLTRQLLAQDLSQLSNQQLLSVFNKLTKYYLVLWQEAIFLDAFDFYGEVILRRILGQEKKKIAAKDLELLIFPPVISFLQQERLSLLKIAEKIMHQPRMFRSILKAKGYQLVMKKYPSLERDLIAHSEKFHWLHNDHASVEFLGPTYFYKNLVILLKNKSKFKAEKDLRSFLKTLVQRKNKVLSKYKFSLGFKNIINFLAFLGSFRDQRKSYNQMINSALEKFVQEFSRRTGLSSEMILNLFFWEAKDVFKFKPKFIKELKDRSQLMFYIVTAPDKYISFQGRQAKVLNDYLKRILKQKSRLLGSSAYGGVVRGRVKIVTNKGEFVKMKRGDILVAPNTRPDYVPIMKLAKAIISEEGGITCHAAIVSRELEIPAVVGVQGAIEVLKDGDLVEVNANKGIIKKINK